jgi:HSP90 family molecular chaperone
MSNEDLYRVSFSLNVIHHLGYGLYSNVPAVLSELVANAHDAGATQITITITPEYVEILDNGQGMTREDINNRYLRMGYQKRKYELIIDVGDENRHVMGRKGIGKLSALSIANIVEVQTTKDGEINGFIMSSYDIDRAIENNADGYSPTPLRPEYINIERGTRIILRDLRHPIEGVETDLRTSLARRFTLMEGDLRFQIILNGRPITLFDRNYFDKVEYI